MAKSQRQRVRERASDRCEYCRLPQDCSALPHEQDHIRSRKHHGPTTLRNLCWSCAYCNASKGSNAAGYDPDSGALVALFDPRREAWPTHFAWDGPILRGKTARARATIDVLRINDPDRMEHRRLLIEAGVFPPDDA